MGFFKNIFKRKEGGTLVGNLLRGGSSAVTGGLLGSGSGLAKWEAEQRQIKEQEVLDNLYQNQAFQMGNRTVNDALVPTMANGSNSNPNIGNNVMKETLKKYWYYVLGAVVALVGLVWYLSKPKKKRF